jgi:hypothetical protein
VTRSTTCFISTTIFPWPKANPEDELAGGGGPPHDGGMEARVAKLEETMQGVREDLAVIKSNYATKADIADTKTVVEKVATSVANVVAEIARTETSMIKWFIGTAVVLASLTFGAAKYFH